MAEPTDDPVWATDGGTTLEPSGGKQAAGWVVDEKPPARFMNWWMNLVYQWVNWHKGLLKGTEAFTGDRLEFAQLVADEPILWTTTTATDDPDPTNDWKILFGFKIDATRYVNIYSGKGATGAGEFAIVTNAVWDVTDQNWVQDDASKPTLGIIWHTGVLRISGQPSGASPWVGWPLSPASVSTSMQMDFSAQGDIGTVGQLSGNTLLVNSTSALNDDTDVDGDLTVSGSVTAAVGYDFSGSHIPSKSIPLSDGAGGAGAVYVDDVAGGQEYWVLDPGEMVSFPIACPHQATGISTIVKMFSSSGTTYKIDAQRSVFNFASATLPTLSNVDSDSGTSTAATVINAASAFSGVTANQADTLHLRIENTGGANQLLIYGVQKTFTDPGPRNT